MPNVEKGIGMMWGSAQRFAKSGGFVGNLGLGGMRLSIEGRPDADRAKATINAALDAGLTLVDTADAYHAGAQDRGHNETLIGDVLAARGDADRVLVATKGGKVRPGDGRWLIDGRPDHLKSAARESARRLRCESIGLYQLHAPDPGVPFAESIGALKDMVDDGLIERAGISNVSVAEIGVAHGILGPLLVSVQNEFSPTAVDGFGTFKKSQQLGLMFMAWRPFGDQQKIASTDNPFVEMARKYGVSLHRLILAWELSLGVGMVPIPGATRTETIRDSAAALNLELDSLDAERLANYALFGDTALDENLRKDEVNA
ncbi:aldo/keto reductase [Arthrobacter sp. ERGS1:01]|uniref:aldo/keto reductase n=1 Tax=Arthrobacter sp. ERGS1:01 TaxID=1704044 RepID=UPI001ED9A235|nr:aldo/keto reductase [Arthrobacter sp. ERGS1:01]